MPLTVTLTESDPAEGQIVGVIDLPSVYALSAPHTANPRLAVARGHRGGAGASGGEELRRGGGRGGGAGGGARAGGRPGQQRADRAVQQPAAAREPEDTEEGEHEKEVVDDPSVVELAVPEFAEAGRPFEVGIYLGYQNNLGRSEIRVPLRLWARPAAGGSPPAGGWQTVTIDQMPCCTLKPGTIPGLSAGLGDHRRDRLPG